MAPPSDPPAPSEGTAVQGATTALPVAPPLARHSEDDAGVPRWTVVVAVVAGAVFVIGALVNAAVTLVAPGAYADLGDWWGAPGPTDRLWHATLGDHPRVWVPLLGVAFELVVGLACLSRRRRGHAFGLAGAAVFHAGLLAMGLWMVALPLLVLFGWAAVATVRAPAPVVTSP